MKLAAAPKYNGVQIVRLMASTMVVVFHATKLASERIGHVMIWRKAAYGVDLFFVVSGFVIVWSSAKLINRPEGWLVFAERRLVRIVPMYWLATTVKILLMLAVPALILHARLTWTTALASYAFLPSTNLDGSFFPLLGVGWTLNFEMAFYLLFGIALSLRWNVYFALAILLSLQGLAIFLRQPTWPAASFYLDPIVFEFLFGMLIGRFCLSRKQLPRAVALSLFFGGFALLLAPFGYTLILRVFFAGIPAAMILWGVTSLEPIFERTPSLLLFLADASYTTYLFHLLVAQAAPILLLRYHLHRPLVSVVLSSLISLLVGAAVHQYLERPMTNWLRTRVRVRRREVIHAA